MGASRGYYSLIQYCPDPSRAESVNVGVLLFSPETGFIEAKTSLNNRRVERFFGRHSFDSGRLNAAKRAIEASIRRNRESFQTLDDLSHFISKLANELRITPPRPMKVFNPEAELGQLFEELVGGLSRKEKPKAEFQELDRLFRQPRLQGRIQFDECVVVPVLGRTLRVPYTFRNGALNLVKTEFFSESERSAADQAISLAIRGDLLQRHDAEDGTKRRLIVVSAFAEAVTEQVRGHVSCILGEYSVRMVRPGGTGQFVQEVIAEAH